MDFSKGIVAGDDSFKGQKWTILGQPYRPLHLTPSSLLMHAEFGPGSFVPTHVHETQDEILHILEGVMEFELEGRTINAGAGDTVSLPMGIAHALYNRSDALARALVVVSPTGRMYDYMIAISGLSDPAEVVRLGAEHEIQFV
ncbi:cupin domain-containing protein [Pseudochelatococcus lubricantis]|uniref:cupin domain-containing protein n=1 Tax=Pseudochelatococcus lubricantis TaxID=1538102 RepID=UPI0035E6B4AC